MNSQPYGHLPGSPASGLVVVCDHATNRLPPGYGTLGLARDDLLRHIAFDIGAAGIARDVAIALGVPAVFSGYSRLLIDCNRGADDPTLVMRLSDGAIVEGNRHLDAAGRQQRLARIVEQMLANPRDRADLNAIRSGAARQLNRRGQK